MPATRIEAADPGAAARRARATLGISTGSSSPVRTPCGSSGTRCAPRARRARARRREDRRGRSGDGGRRCSSADSPSTSRPTDSSPRRCSTRCATAATCAACACCTPPPRARARRCRTDSRSSARSSIASRSTARSVDGDGADELRERLLARRRRSRDVHVGVVGERRSSTRSATTRGDTRARGVDRSDHDRRRRASAGLDVVVEAEQSTIAGLVEAIVEHSRVTPA